MRAATIRSVCPRALRRCCAQTDTWGKDVKTWLGKDQDSYNKAWNNHDLAKARQSKKNFMDMENSWHEQRLWGIDSALQALGDHPLAAEIQSQLQPPVAPSTDGLAATSDRNFTVGGTSIGFDDSGALLIGEAKLAAFTYRSCKSIMVVQLLVHTGCLTIPVLADNDVDMANFDAQYRAAKPGSTSEVCGDKDFCKTGMCAGPNAARLWFA